MPLCPEFGNTFIGLDNSFILVIVGFISYYLPAVRGYLIVLTSFNRLTAIVWPYRHSKVGLFCFCTLIIVILVVGKILDPGVNYCLYCGTMFHLANVFQYSNFHSFQWLQHLFLCTSHNFRRWWDRSENTLKLKRDASGLLWIIIHSF